MIDLMSSALLILRIVLGLVVVVHGLQKASSRFRGGGLDAEAERLTADGVRGGRLSAGASALTQIGAGTLCVAGLLTPLGAAGIIGVMVVAISTKLRHGFWVNNDGLEFPLFLACSGVVLALSGPGHWSLDHAIPLHINVAESWGAVVLGVVSGALSVSLLREPTKARIHKLANQEDHS